MRIVWQSNSPTNNSGYGKQTALFVPRINALPEHEIIAISSPYSFGGSPIEWNDIPIFGTARDAGGNDTIISNHEYCKADLTFVLADPFGLMKSASALSQINVAHWFPVDTSPLASGDVMVLREGQGIPVAMSRFGERILRDEGAEPLYVPHAVDRQVFCPGDPQPYRDTVHEIGPETFTIGLVAMNRDVLRKGIPEQMTAFAEFHRRHPDSYLALHTSPVNNPGLNLPGLAARLGIAGAVGYPDSYSYDLSLITDTQMASWYQGLDILSLCSYGEGFGLPLIEAQSCGVPVVTTDGSAMSELCGGGWLVEGSPFWSSGHDAWWTRPDVSDIVEAYEAAWQAKQDGSIGQIRKAAYEFAMLYDVDRVFEEYMKPVLAQIEERIK